MEKNGKGACSACGHTVFSVTRDRKRLICLSCGRRGRRLKERKPGDWVGKMPTMVRKRA